MKNRFRLMLPILAVIVGIAASAFTTISNSSRSDTEYVYISTDQSIGARETASNYEKGSASCPGGNNECSVVLDQDFGTNPDFTNVTFDPSTGMPNGGSDFVSNSKQP